MLGLLKSLYNWFTDDIYDFVTEAFAYAIEWIVVGALQFKIWFAQFAWDIASNIMANIGLSQAINDAFAALDIQMIAYLTFFRLPEAINILFQALVTKFTIKLIL